MTWTRGVVAVVIVAGIAALTLASLKPHPQPPQEITLAEAKKERIARTVSGAGHVQTAELVKVSSNITGELLSLTVKEGALVKRGQVLGQIDRRRYDAAYRAQLSSIRAGDADIKLETSQIQKLTDDLARAKKLKESNLASAADVQQAETLLAVEESRLESAKQRVDQSRAQAEDAHTALLQTTLLAPVSGTVLELDHRVGERVRGSDFAEDVVMLLGGLSSMEVKAEVGEHEVVHLAEGQDSEIELDAFPDQKFKGRVVAVAKNAVIKNPGTDAEVTSFAVRVALLDPPPQALPGMSAQVSIEAEAHDDAVTVPVQCVTVRENTGSKPEAGVPQPAGAQRPKLVKVVFVEKDGKVEQRSVRVGIAGKNAVEVLDGLKAGEHVVEGPYRVLARELKDGDRVAEKKKEQG